MTIVGPRRLLCVIVAGFAIWPCAYAQALNPFRDTGLLTATVTANAQRPRCAGKYQIEISAAPLLARQGISRFSAKTTILLRASASITIENKAAKVPAVSNCPAAWATR